MMQNDTNSQVAMYIDKIKRPDFFEELKFEHYVYFYF